MDSAEDLLTGELVARQQPLGEEIVGVNGVGGLGPSRQSAQPGQGGAQRTTRVGDARNYRADDGRSSQPAGDLHCCLVNQVLRGLHSGVMVRGGVLG